MEGGGVARLARTHTSRSCTCGASRRSAPGLAGRATAATQQHDVRFILGAALIVIALLVGLIQGIGIAIDRGAGCRRALVFWYELEGRQSAQ